MKKLNIVFGKYGKTMSFDQGKWGIVGGDHEAPMFLSSLAQMNPNINFYLIGRSDWSRIPQQLRDKININNNIFNMWEDFPGEAEFPEISSWPIEFVKRNNIKIDYGFIVSGLTGYANMQNAVLKLDGSGDIAKTTEMLERYTGPIIRFLNHTGIPYSECGEDPRYYPAKARDLFKFPKYIMSTRDIPANETKPILHVKEYFSKELHEIQVPIVDKDVSKWFMAAEPDRRLKEPGKRTQLMSVYSNNIVNNSIDKFPHIKEYVLDNFPEALIIGKWDEDERVKPYLDKIQDIGMIDHGPEMLNTKYAFMISVMKNWTTSKFYKHLMYGIIPFHHPFSHTKHLPGPDFLDIQSPKDFKEKIEYLESDEKRYLDLWHELQSILKEEHFTGEYLNNIFLNEIKENIDTSQFNLDETKHVQFKLSCMYKDLIIDTKELVRPKASKLF